MAGSWGACRRRARSWDACRVARPWETSRRRARSWGACRRMARPSGACHRVANGLSAGIRIGRPRSTDSRTGRRPGSAGRSTPRRSARRGWRRSSIARTRPMTPATGTRAGPPPVPGSPRIRPRPAGPLRSTPVRRPARSGPTSLLMQRAVRRSARSAVALPLPSGIIGSARTGRLSRSRQGRGIGSRLIRWKHRRIRPARCPSPTPSAPGRVPDLVRRAGHCQVPGPGLKAGQAPWLVRAPGPARWQGCIPSPAQARVRGSRQFLPPPGRLPGARVGRARHAAIAVSSS